MKIYSIRANSKYIVLAKIIIIMIYILFGPESVIAASKKSKGFAIVKRINSFSGFVVCDIKKGIFKTNDKIDIFSKDGEKIADGLIKSVYSQEIYVIVPEVDVNVIQPGFVILKNISSEEVNIIFFNGNDFGQKYKSSDITRDIRQQIHAIRINNPSFEEDVPDKSWKSGYEGQWHDHQLNGWITTGVSGTKRPTVSVLYPDGIPDGLNIAFSNQGTMTQTLNHVVKEGFKYTLKVRVGHRADFDFGVYSIKLLAGGYVLGEENSLRPTKGTWLVSEIIYSSLIGDNRAGLPITIRIETKKQQVNYDLVELFEEPQAKTVDYTNENMSSNELEYIREEVKKDHSIQSINSPSVVMLKAIQKTKPPVSFNHAEHDNKIGNCNSCHHKEEPNACSYCHKAKAEGRVIDLKEAFHTKCKGCHQKEKKGPTKCDGCHRK